MSTQDFLKDVRHDFYRGKVRTEFVQKYQELPKNFIHVQLRFVNDFLIPCVV